ncbi:MAG TPA: protein kinase, partial [Gemmataceae bacterium]|nr:protein kinase [Gemmataceae bacterium]
MPNASVCPDIAQFKKLATGQLSSPDKEALLDHLESCPACVQRVEALSAKDTLGDLMRPERTVGAGPAGNAPVSILLACSGCGKSLKIKADLAGKKVKCPNCQAVILVPPAERLQESSPPPPPGAEEALTRTATIPACSRDSATVSVAGTGQAPQAGTNDDLCDFLAPAQSPDELGRLGPYRVLNVLGAGGMGVVFRAEDPHLQRLVALKALLPGLAASGSAKQRFLREARAAAALKHDHVVTIHQVGEDRGVPYLAMEFLEGEPLDECLKREGKLPVAEVLRIGREMAEGLSAAHEHGLIHRDIKPANVWLEGKKGRVKILDFGLARAATDESHLTQSGAIMGTPAFMAPEQAQGKNVEPRSDLFSLGCVLYRMATGKAPFR